MLGPKAREEIFATLAQFDAASWAVSALSIFFCTAAAFPVAGPAGIMLRSVAIHLGRSLFLVASTITAMVFALGLSLVYIFPLWWHVFFVSALLLLVPFLFTLGSVADYGSFLLFLFLHIWARCQRLGFGRSFCSLFWCRTGASWTPLIHVILLLLNFSWILCAAPYMLNKLLNVILLNNNDVLPIYL